MTNSAPRLVQMIPLRRCGSHAIRLRLNLNPGFYSPYPLHLVDFIPLLPLYGSLEKDDNYFQLVVDLLGLQALSPVKWEVPAIDPVRFFESIRSLPRSIHTVAWEILIEAARLKKAGVVMCKSLDNVHYWQELLRLYPEMRFLNLVRDPRAQVSSMNRAIIHEFDSLLNVEILMRAHQAALSLLEAHPEMVLTVRYEDFVNHEETTLREICDFLGLQFGPEMLNISKSEEALRLAQQSALWESNSSKPILTNVDKFKASLSFQEIEQIETVTASVMDKYGYTKMTPAQAKLTPEIWDASRNRSQNLRVEAWDRLKKERPQDYILRRRRADYIALCRRNLEAAGF